MDVRVKTDVSSEPLSESFLKNFIKYDDSDTNELALINTLAKAARVQCEKFTGLSFAEKTLIVSIFPEDLIDDSIELPYGPHISITSVTYYDSEGNSGTMTLNTDYYKSGNNFVRLNFFQKIFLTLDVTEYRVEYVAGYGNADTETLPDDLKILAAQQANRWYMKRGDQEPLVLSNEIKSGLMQWRRLTL